MGTFNKGFTGISSNTTNPTTVGFSGVTYNQSVSPAVYQCLTKSLTETVNSTIQVVYGSETDAGGFTTAIDPAELEAGEFWFQYGVTAGADGAIISISDITVEVTYEADVSSSQPSTDAVLRTDSLRGVVIGGGAAVAVGASSTIYYSTNKGASWSVASSPVDCDFRDVVHDGRLFYACGTGGTLISSADGITWNVERRDAATDYIDLAIGRNVSVVAIGSNDTIIAKSLTSGGFNYIGRFA